MIVRTLAAAALVIAASSPALAHDRARTAPDPASCTRQQVHTPAGKMVHAAPIVRCRTATATEIADREARKPLPTEQRTARD